MPMSLPLPTIASRVMTFCPVSFPRTITRLQGLLNNQNATASVITQLLVTDPLLCAGVLGQANALKPCLSAAHAISSLGLEAVQGILRATEPVPEDRRQLLSTWCDEANATGLMVRLLVRYLRGRRRIMALQNLDDESLHLLGLLHNLGHAVAIVSFPEQYRAAGAAHTLSSEPFRHQIKEALGLAPGDLGYMLCRQWRLPEMISLTNRYFNHPHEIEDSEGATAAAVVHISRTLVRALGMVGGHDRHLDPIAEQALGLLNLRSGECEALMLQFLDAWDDQEDYEPGGGAL